MVQQPKQPKQPGLGILLPGVMQEEQNNQRSQWQSWRHTMRIWATEQDRKW